MTSVVRGDEGGTRTATSLFCSLQVTAAQDTYVHPARPHLLAGQAPVHNSQLNVQSLYHMQMPHASIPHHALQGGGQALLQLPQQLETAQQLGLADKHELDRLDSPDGDIPTSTDYRHKQRRKANERPSV